MLDEAGAHRHLVARGLLSPHSSVTVTPLRGGVSSDIVAVSSSDLDVVVKQSLPRLRVSQEWLADKQRIVREAHALELVATLTPELVPRVVDFDNDTWTLVLERAPADWRNWRDELLDGRIDNRVAAKLGTALGGWQLGTSQVPPAEFFDTRSFVELRIDPFYYTVASRHPEVSERVRATADALLRTPSCLVHGDFSPKNVLHGSDQLWVLDWEVVHVGDPCFDVAFLLTHLLLKAIHRSQDAERYRIASQSFFDSYRRVFSVGSDEPESLVANIGCLLLARVDGKSPAPYLSAAERVRVRELGLQLLSDPPRDALAAWEAL